MRLLAWTDRCQHPESPACNQYGTACAIRALSSDPSGSRLRRGADAFRGTRWLRQLSARRCLPTDPAALATPGKGEAEAGHAALASDDGRIFSRKAGRSAEASIPEGTENARRKEEALRLGRELLRGTTLRRTWNDRRPRRQRPKTDGSATK